MCKPCIVLPLYILFTVPHRFTELSVKMTNVSETIDPRLAHSTHPVHDTGTFVNVADDVSEHDERSDVPGDAVRPGTRCRSRPSRCESGADTPLLKHAMVPCHPVRPSRDPRDPREPREPGEPWEAWEPWEPWEPREPYREPVKDRATVDEGVTCDQEQKSVNGLSAYTARSKRKSARGHIEGRDSVNHAPGYRKRVDQGSTYDDGTIASRFRDKAARPGLVSREEFCAKCTLLFIEQPFNPCGRAPANTVHVIIPAYGACSTAFFKEVHHVQGIGIKETCIKLPSLMTVRVAEVPSPLWTQWLLRGVFTHCGIVHVHTAGESWANPWLPVNTVDDPHDGGMFIVTANVLDHVEITVSPEDPLTVHDTSSLARRCAADSSTQEVACDEHVLQIERLLRSMSML
jgi:hypothetical protein